MKTKMFIGVCLLMLPMVVTAGNSGWLTEQFDNGLKVMIMENHQVPQVNISTTVKVGAKNESDYFDGATHLLEHLILFRGTDDMTGEQVGDAMKAHGAYFNGYTSADWTDFVISLPKDYLDFALRIHRDMLFHSNFPKAEMDKERQAVYEEINISEDNPIGKAYRTSLATLYGKHPYAKNVLGTQEKILNIPRDSVYAYYKRYYAPNNMTMVIVGDIDPQKTMDLVKKYYADIPKGQVAKDRYAEPPKRDSVAEIEIRKDVNQAYLMMMSIGPSSDNADQFPLDIMASLLGDGESSRLYKRLKDSLGLVYSIDYDFYTSKYEGKLLVYASLDPKNIDTVETEIVRLFDEIKQEGFTSRELQKAKNAIVTGYYASIERGLDLADEMAQYDSFAGYDYVLKYPDNIEQVTLAELNGATQKYLNTDSYVKTMVVPK